MFKLNGCLVILISSHFNYVISTKCFECSSITGDCNGSTCEGSWCVARIVQRTSPDTNIYTKECSSTNPNNPKPQGCIKVENSGTTAISCGCQTDFCNSADGIRQYLENSTTTINGTRDLTPAPISTLSNMSKALMQKPNVNYSNIAQDDNGLSVSCYECNSVKGDCVTGDCKGRWCKTSISEDANAGTKVVSKGCSTTHPNSVAYDGCVKVNSQAVTTISCGCRKSNFCNTAENVDVWLSRPVPPPGNLTSFESFVNPNSKTTDAIATKSLTAKRRCLCSKGSSDCPNGECYGEICAWTVFDADKTKPSTASIGRSIHQYCSPTGSSGCDNPDYKVVSSPDGTPIETSSRTCRCDSRDFCNHSSSLFYSKLVSVLSLSVAFMFHKFS